MILATVLRNGWMDLLSATAFLSIWLVRDRFDYDTLREWLWWPVVFEMFAIFAVLLAGMLGSIRTNGLRNAWFILVAIAYLSGAWLAGAIAGMPHVWMIALWLLLARLNPPSGMRFGELRHREWIQTGAGYSGTLWATGFVLTILLMFVFSSEATRDASGELRSTAPTWIFPLVWAPYFFAEAILLVWRSSPKESWPTE
jgi:hypothetical protein